MQTVVGLAYFFSICANVICSQIVFRCKASKTSPAFIYVPFSMCSAQVRTSCCKSHKFSAFWLPISSHHLSLFLVYEFVPCPFLLIESPWLVFRFFSHNFSRVYSQEVCFPFSRCSHRFDTVLGQYSN